MVNALAAASSLVLLLTVPVSVFVVVVSAWVVTCSGVVSRLSTRSRRRGARGLVTALSPDGMLYAAIVHPTALAG